MMFPAEDNIIYIYIYYIYVQETGLIMLYVYVYYIYGMYTIV